MPGYKTTIGLEIHAELKTHTKMFCASLNDPDEKEPNKNVCPICMGHPGTLPVPNIEAIKKVIQVGKALNCKIAEFSKFDRKNYFYPDLPKGYQISQYDKPFCGAGYLNIDQGLTPSGGSDPPKQAEEKKKIRITRIHLEEDAGRLVHPRGADYSLVDFNRAGVPLMELVTEPDIETSGQARRFAEELQLILRYLDASDADMEKGQMRVEVNISLSKDKKLGTKVEIKNLNSFRAVDRTIFYEIERQTEILDSGEKVIQETRGWDESTGKTFSQRIKEEAHEYRYFPEPDIPPIKLTDELKMTLPELPQNKRRRFIEEFKIDPKLVEIFVRDPELADYYEEVISEVGSWEEYGGHDNESKDARQKLMTLAANYLTSDLRGLLEGKKLVISEHIISPENFAEFVWLIHAGKLSSRGAKDLLPEMLDTGGDPSTLMDKKGLRQVSDEGTLDVIVGKVIEGNADAVEKYKAGNENLLQFLVGQVMKESKGTANPQIAAELLKKRLI